MRYPTILLLSLQKESFWDDIYAESMRSISARAELKEITDVKDAMDFLSSNIPLAIVLTDPATALVTTSTVHELNTKLKQYANQGGTLILATQWVNLCRPEDADRWFELWRLQWRYGTYDRKNVRLNEESVGHRNWVFQLPDCSSQRAVYLKGVMEEDGVYWGGKQAAVAFRQIGLGYVGYIGDVNNEKASQAVLLAMCGL